MYLRNTNAPISLAIIIKKIIIIACTSFCFTQHLVHAVEAEMHDLVYDVITFICDVAKIKNTFQSAVIHADASNAFATINNRIYVLSGMLHELESIKELVAVLAHEIGHVEKLHIPKQIEFMKKQQKLLILTLPIFFLSKDIIANNFFTHSRNAECDADNFAIKILQTSGIGVEPFINFNKKQELNQKISIIQDVRDNLLPHLTHPTTFDRIENIRSRAVLHKLTPHSHIFQKRIHALENRFTFLQYALKAINWKIRDYLEVYRMDFSDAANYGRSIVYAKDLEYTKSLELIGELIRKYPNNSYFYDLQGEVFLKNGDVQKSIESRSKAFELNKKSIFIRRGLAESLGAAQKPNYQAIIKLLSPAFLAEDHLWGICFEPLTNAYYELGMLSMFHCLRAEFFLHDASAKFSASAASYRSLLDASLIEANKALSYLKIDANKITSAEKLKVEGILKKIEAFCKSARITFPKK